MTIFDVLALVGGLCLFLFGMNVMGDSLERRAGGGLKLLLGKLTGNKFKAFLTGLGVTAVIQSSSATTVMVEDITADMVSCYVRIKNVVWMFFDRCNTNIIVRDWM